MPSANEDIFNAGVRHAHFLERLKAGEVSRIVRFLNGSVWPDLVEVIKRMPDGPSRERVRQMLVETRGIIRGGVRSASKDVRTRLGKIALSESEFARTVLRENVPLEISFSSPSLSSLTAAIDREPMLGLHLNKWWDTLTQSTQRRVEQAIRIGLVESETTPQIVRRIRGTKALGFKDGVLATSNRNATAIVRTAVNHATTRARELTYKANDDVVKGVRYVATLDGRTTLICQNLDGKVFPIGEGERPPQHIQCRSTTTPVVKSYKELGLQNPPAATRASLNGQVPGRLTYSQWLRQQPKSFQDSVLGPTRARAFRGNQLTLDKFVDSSGRRYTLDELRRTHGLSLGRKSSG